MKVCTFCGYTLPREALVLAVAEAIPPEEDERHPEDRARVFSVLGTFCSRVCVSAYLAGAPSRS